MTTKNFNVKNGLTTGNITLDATTSNIATLGNILANGNITGNNLTINVAISTANLGVMANITTDIKPNANGTYDIGKPDQRWNNLYIANTLFLDGQSISANTTSISTTGNLVVANANLGNAATANYFIGSGANLANLAGANVIGTVANATYAVTAGTAYAVTGANVSGTVANANYATYSGSATTAGTVTTNAQPNITSLGNLANLTVNGNIDSTGIVNLTNTTNSTGTGSGALIVAGGASVTKDLYVGGTIYTPNLVATSYTELNVGAPLLYLTSDTPYPYDYEAGFFTHFIGGPGNIYQHTGFVRNHVDSYWYLFSNAAEPAGSLVDLANANLVFDSLKLGNVIANGTVTANFFSGDGGSLTNVTATSGTVTSAATAGTVTASSQPNITSVGTLTSLTVSGNTNLGNVGNVHITGGSNNYFLQTDGFGNLNWANSNVYVTSNITNVVAGSQINVNMDYANATYPGGVFTIYQLGPVSVGVTDIWEGGTATKNAYSNYEASTVNTQNVSITLSLANATFSVQTSDTITIGNSTITGSNITALGISGTGGTYSIPDTYAYANLQTQTPNPVSVSLTTSRGSISSSGTTLINTQPTRFNVSALTGSFTLSTVPYWSLNQTFNWNASVVGTASAGNVTYTGGAGGTLTTTGATSGTSGSLDSTISYSLSSSDYYGAGLNGAGNRTIPTTATGTVSAASKYYPLFYKTTGSSSNPTFATTDTHNSNNYALGQGANTTATTSDYLWIATPNATAHTFAFTFLSTQVDVTPDASYTSQTISGQTYNFYGFTNYSAITFIYTKT